MLAIVMQPGEVEFNAGLLPSAARELVAVAALLGGADRETEIKARYADGTVEPDPQAIAALCPESREAIAALCAEIRPNRRGFRHASQPGLHVSMRVATFTVVPDASAAARAARTALGGPFRESLAAALESIGRPALAAWARGTA